MIKIRHIVLQSVFALLLVEVSLSQTLEITDSFKKVFKELAKEEFRNYVYNQLKEKEPLIAASAYNLIERVVAGDSVIELQRQTILSVLDYAMFVQIQSIVQRQFPRSKILYNGTDSIDLNQYKKLMQVGALLTYEFLARDSLYVVWGGMRKMLAEETKFVSSHFIEGKKFGFAIYELIQSKRDEIAEIMRWDRLLKNVFADLSPVDSTNVNAYIEEYSRFTETRVATLRALADSVSTRLRTKLNYVYQAYGSSSGIEHSEIFRTLAPFVYSVAAKKFNRLEVNYNKELVAVLLNYLEAIYNENVTGLKYKLGLWMGAFFNGNAWDPPLEGNFIVSLRLNDRLQYTICGSAQSEFFIYVGGFADALVKELAKSNGNRFFFSGLGYTFHPVSMMVSGFLPAEGRSKTGGIVVSIMYDVPLGKIANAL